MPRRLTSATAGRVNRVRGATRHGQPRIPVGLDGAVARAADIARARCDHRPPRSGRKACSPAGVNRRRPRRRAACRALPGDSAGFARPRNGRVPGWHYCTGPAREVQPWKPSTSPCPIAILVPTIGTCGPPGPAACARHDGPQGHRRLRPRLRHVQLRPVAARPRLGAPRRPRRRRDVDPERDLLRDRGAAAGVLRARGGHRVSRRHARAPHALAEERARQQPHAGVDDDRRARLPLRRHRHRLPADAARSRVRERGSSARRRRARPARALRRRRRDAGPERAGDARVVRARRGLSPRRVPAGADRRGVRLRAHDRARGSGAGHRRRRRDRRLHGDPAGAGAARGDRARRRRARQRRRPHRGHRLRFAAQHVVGDAAPRLPDRRREGPRRAEPRLLRPVDVAPDQPALRAEVRRARCASCRRSSPIRCRTAGWCA